MSFNIICKLLISIFLTIGVVSNAMANDSRYTDEQWHFTLTPLFLWGMNIDGSSTVGPEQLPLSIDFEDVLENLTAVFTIHFEMQKRNWTFFAEYQYVDLEPSLKAPSGINVGIDFINQMGELGAAYRIATLGINELEIIGGARITRQDLDVEAGPGIPLIDVTETWVDGFAGMRVFTHISEKWTFVGRGDIGAGGSDFVWNITGMFDYQFKDWGSIFFGYRWLDYDYETGSGFGHYAYDALQQGPLGGLSIHW